MSNEPLHHDEHRALNLAEEINEIGFRNVAAFWRLMHYQFKMDKMGEMGIVCRVVSAMAANPINV